MSYIMIDDNEYWQKDDLDKTNANWRLAISARGPGKSYQGKKQAIDNFFDKGKQFGLVRRYDNEIKIDKVTGYWRDMIGYFYDKGQEKYGDRYVGYDVVPRKGQWKIYGYRDEDHKDDLGVIGYYFALNVTNQYKSVSYPDVTMLIVEEFIPENCRYLPAEIDKLLNLVSTIKRNRTDFVIYMFGNSLDRNCPYFNELNINVRDIKQGEIKCYTYYGGAQGNSKNTLAIEYLRPVYQSEESDAYVTFGRQQEQMIYRGEWQTKEYNKYTEDEFYSRVPELGIILDYQQIHLYVYLFRDGDDVEAYVSENRMHSRIEYITLFEGRTNIKHKRLSMHGNYTPTNRIKKLLKELYLNDMVKYCNNLTGVDFENVLDEF